jgi:hypothetical protein
MANPLILYSVNTWLAYVVAERFYVQQHYVWCSPYYHAASVPEVDITTPPTSTPCDIYHNLEVEIRLGDRHSAKVADNRVGILRGATYKRTAGVISEAQEKDIAAIVERAETRDFRPLLYLIPYREVRGKLREAPVDKRAHPLSTEFIIEDLPRSSFDVIEPGRRH